MSQMDKVVAVGSLVSPLGLQLACAGTLSKYAKAGNAVTIVMAAGARSTPEKNTEQEHQAESDGTVTMMQNATLEGSIEKSFTTIGASQVRFAYEFDHEVVSQGNVDTLWRHISDVNPDVAVIPYHKSSDPGVRILGRCALLACRWVQNVLMYDTSAKPPFRPGIFSILSQGQSRMKNALLAEFGGNKQTMDDGLEQLELMQTYYTNGKWHGKAHIEALQSHRLQLLPDQTGKAQGGIFE